MKLGIKIHSRFDVLKTSVEKKLCKKKDIVGIQYMQFKFYTFKKKKNIQN